MNEELERSVRQRFPEAVAASQERGGMLELTLRPDDLVPVARFLKHELGFDFFDCLSAVDRKEAFEVVIHLWSMARAANLVLKVRLSHDEPVVDTLVPVWAGANWYEREAFDLFGILFRDHPDLRRILLPDDFEGFPMRKDYLETD